MKCYLLILVSVVLFWSSLFAQESSNAAVEALLAGDHEAALKVLSGDLAALANEDPATTEDELRLIKARLLLTTGKAAEAVATCDGLLRDFPESQWRHKAVFLKAKALASQRKFAAALEIYEKEAGRIFFAGRQDEVAGKLIEFAELFEKEPAEAEVDAPKADYGKALALYQQVLETEASEAIREQVRYRIVLLQGKLQQWTEAAAAAVAYLNDYDPEWRGLMGSVGRMTNTKNEGVKMEGKNRYQVRYRHAEALHRAKLRSQAVSYLKELDGILERGGEAQKALRADAHWLKLMAMTAVGGNVHPKVMKEWLAESREFLKRYPDHIWAMQVAFKIAFTYNNKGMFGEAEAAYRAFLDGRDYVKISEKPLTTDAEGTADFEARKRKHGERMEFASYRLGWMLLMQKKFDAAAKQWTATARDFPNGKHWADAQKGMVTVAFEKTVEKIRMIADAKDQDKARSAARASIEKFLTAHPLDSRVPGLLMTLGEISFQKGLAMKKVKEGSGKESFEKAIADWLTLISKYPQSAHAASAKLRIGKVYEEQLKDLEKAVKAYSDTKDPKARMRRDALLGKTLTAASKQVATTTGRPMVELNLRNIPEVQVKQYWLNFESFFQKAQNLKDIEELDIDLVEPDNTWKVEIPGYAKYLPITHQLEVSFPEKKSGVCVIRVEGGDLESTTVVVRSDLDIAVRSSRSEALVFAHDAKSGKVMPEVKVILADGAKILATGKTGADGVWRYQNESLNEVAALRVLAVSERGIATHDLSLQNLVRAEADQAKAVFYTPLAAYRPGEEVDLKAVIREMKDGEFLVPPAGQRNYLMKVLTQGGRLLLERKVDLSEFGTSEMEFTIPDRVQGDLVKVTLERGAGELRRSFSKVIPIHRNVLRQAKITLEFDQNAVRQDGKLIGTISAKYRWGAPLANRNLTLVMPGRLQRTLQTDDEGKASFQYSVADAGSLALLFEVRMPEVDAEPARAIIRREDREYSVYASMSQKVVIADREFGIELQSKKTDGGAVSRKLMVKIFREEGRVTDPLLGIISGLSELQKGRGQSAPVRETELTTDPKTGKVRAAFKLTDGGNYFYQIFDSGLSVDTGRFFVSDSTDEQRLHLLKGLPHYREGMTASLELYSRLPEQTPALITIENSRLLEYRVIELKKGSQQIEIPMTASHSPHTLVSLMALDGRKLHKTEQQLRASRWLDVNAALEGEPSPGAKVQVKVLVKDAGGKAMKAETAVSLIHVNDTSGALDGEFVSYCRAGFTMGSNVGFRHQGKQCNADLTIREELQVEQRGRTFLSEQAAAGYLSDLAVPVVTNPVLPFGDQDEFADAFSDRAPSPSLRREKSEIVRSATVVTDENGVAVIEITLPTGGGDWKLVAEAVTTNGATGSAIENVSVREGLTVKSLLPGKVLEGDVLQPIFVISRDKTTEAAKGGLKLTRTAENGEPVVSSHELNFAKGQGTVELSTPQLTAKAEFELTATVTLGNLSASENTTVPVQPWGAPVMDQGGILAPVGGKSFTLTLPDGATNPAMRLRVQPTLNAILLELASNETSSFIAEGPRTDKHIIGQLLANAFLHAYGSERGMDEVLLRELRARLESGVAALTASQNDRGGWTQVVGRAKADLVATAIAYEALVASSNVGIAIDEAVLKKTVGYLNESIKVAGPNDRALIQYALSCSDSADFSACNRLFRARTELNAFGRAHLAASFLKQGRRELARQLIGQLGAVPANNSITLGRALQVQAAIDPNHQSVSALEAQLWDRCGALGFSSDLGRGVALVGLSDLFRKREIRDEDFKATVSVNGTVVARMDSTKLSSFTDIAIPSKSVKTGKNEIKVTMEGRGSLRVGGSLFGTLPKYPTKKDGVRHVVHERNFLHHGLLYRGLPLKAESTSPVKTVKLGQRIRVNLRVTGVQRNGGDLLIWEKIPAGFEYVRGSLQGRHSGASIQDEHLVITHVGTMSRKSFSYEIVAKRSGKWRVAPTTLVDPTAPEQVIFGSEEQLIVLKRGQESSEPYRFNFKERLELAKLHFSNDDHAAAEAQLAAIRKADPAYQSAEIANMTLWIELAKEKPSARLVADSFEILNELAPDSEIPFATILKVAVAYRELGEFERGMDVFLATIEAGFGTDSFIGAALEDQGRFLDSVAYQLDLWKQFPDEGQISNALFALSQQLLSKAPEAGKLSPAKGSREDLDPEDIYHRAIQVLHLFRLHHPEHPLTDDAAFSSANALFITKQFKEMLASTRASQKAFPKSDFSDSFRYMEALAAFWLRDYDTAFAAAKSVADGSGKDRDLAAYICAQILHARGKPSEAMKWYERVKNEYPDAGDAIAWFERKKIELDEVKVIRSGEEVKLTLKHRNITKADLQIYRVDLMRLYLREKNLSKVSQVNLAGISPKHEVKVDLAATEAASDQETTVSLPMKDDGAYLIICRGDYLYTSGLVLVTPLKMEVQEDSAAGSIRVNLTDRVSGDFLDSVHVKAIGTSDEKFQSGETDLRGVWKGDGLNGKATVIARDEKGRYAFFRGEQSLGMVANNRNAIPQQLIQKKGKVDYGYNNALRQESLIQDNTTDWDKNRRRNGKAIEINKALKK